MSKSTKHGYTILLVDDDPSSETKKELLVDRGHWVLLYQDGKRVIEDLEDGIVYHIAVVDRSLGDSVGDEVMKALKEAYPDHPIICTSGWPWERNMPTS